MALKAQVLLFDEVRLTDLLKRVTPYLITRLPHDVAVGFGQLFWQAVKFVVVIADLLQGAVAVDARAGFAFADAPPERVVAHAYDVAVVVMHFDQAADSSLPGDPLAFQLRRQDLDSS